MKKLLIAACLLVTSAAHAGSYAVPRSIVHLITAGPGRASTVVIAEGYAITSAHVTDVLQRYPKSQLTIETPEGPVKGKIVKSDDSRDLALVAANVHCPCAHLADYNLDVDDPIVAVGFPLSPIVRVQTATEGRVQGTNPAGLQLMSVNITYGNSGGGVFSIATGDLVGVVDSMVGIPQGPPQLEISDTHHYLSFMVPIKTLREFLNLPQGQPTATYLKKLG